MSKEQTATPGPWEVVPSTMDEDVPAIRGQGQVFITVIDGEGTYRQDWINARMMAAAPTMADAIKGLIGLCQILRNRDDCPTEIRQALTHNHRLIAGYEALTAAGIEGFQPSDFDLDKSAEATPPQGGR